MGLFSLARDPTRLKANTSANHNATDLFAIPSDEFRMPDLVNLISEEL